MRSSRLLGIIASGRFDEDCFSYTGTYTFTQDGSDWLLTLKTSGTLTLTKPAIADLFLVGGGGAGGRNSLYVSGSRYASPGGGGGGGYTKTVKKATLGISTFAVTIGAGGDADGSSTSSRDGKQSKFVLGSTTYTANGGEHGGAGGDSQGGNGGAGGSGGGGALAGAGGTNGADGTDGGNNTYITGDDGGVGQGTTTRAFGDSTGTCYAAGGKGGGGGTTANGSAGTANMGNGGSGASSKYGNTAQKYGGDGGSGVVLIRNAR